MTLHSDKPELTGPVIGKLSLRPCPTRSLDFAWEIRSRPVGFETAQRLSYSILGPGLWIGLWESVF